MRLFRTSLLILALALPAGGAFAELKLPRVSQNSTIKQTVGLTDITVTYSRPGVKGRVIWGELVPYDQPWRTGANEATTITLSEDVMIGGTKLAAGSYALLTIPGKEEWQVVVNKDKDMWGSNGYKAESDLVRIKVKPTAAEHMEWMAFGFENLTFNSADLVLRWEKLRLAIPITNDDLEQVVTNAKAEVAAAKPDDWRAPYRAANFMFDASLEPALTAEWAKKSAAIEGNYQTLTLMAKIAAKDGKTKDAIAHAEKAIKAGKESKEKVDTSGTEKLLSQWTAKP
jgi:hypothetical protein